MYYFCRPDKFLLIPANPIYLNSRCVFISLPNKFAPALLATQYAEEIWALYEHGNLNPEVELTGRFECEKPPVDLEGVMREIDDAREEEAARLLRLQEL